MRRSLWQCVLPAVLLLWVVCGLVLAPVPAAACSCAPPPELEVDVDQRTAVFTGRVVSVSKPGVSLFHASDSPVKVVLQVSRVWKGTLAPRTVLYTALSSASCGYDGFKAGSEYLVFANGSRERLETSICTRTKPLSEAQRELQALGVGYVPSSASGNSAAGGAADDGQAGASSKALWSLGIMVAGAVLLAALHKRRHI